MTTIGTEFPLIIWICVQLSLIKERLAQSPLSRLPHSRSPKLSGRICPIGMWLLVMSTVYQYCKQLNGEKEGSRVLAACISDSTRTKKVIHKYVHIYIYTVYAQYRQCIYVYIYTYIYIYIYIYIRYVISYIYIHMTCNIHKESVL